MNNKERLELAKWAIRYAQKNGATEATVSITRSRSVEVEVRNQNIETIKESTENGLSVQIYRDHKFSEHNTNNFVKNDLERFISEAVEATKYLSPDKNNVITDPSLYPTDLSLNLGLTDHNHASVTPEHRIRVAMETEDAARQGHSAILTVTSGFSDNFSESVRVHSNGFEGERTGTRFSTGASVTIRDGQARPSGFFWADTRFLNNLPKPAELATRAVDDAVRQLGQTKVESGQYTMIVENRLGGNMLRRLFQAMTARAVQQRSSFLIDMLEKPIGSEHLTITDHPLIIGGLASRLFDNEGIAARRRVMIDKGILKSYYIDNLYGRKLGLTPNGGSPSNVLIEAGLRSPQQIIESMDKAILVTSFLGGNANPTTGDFSFGISGQLIEKGKIVKPVNEMNITGNTLELWKNLIETANDPFPFSSIQSPTMVFAKVGFSGL